MWRYNYVNSTELYHYGIPGMKWGQRIASKWNDHFDKRRVKLEEKYRNQGMSKKDAQIKAEKTVKGEQITTGVASAVGTAALGYAAYRLLRGPKSKSNAKTNIKVTNGPITMDTLTEKINSKAGKKVTTYTPIKINKKTALEKNLQGCLYLSVLFVYNSTHLRCYSNRYRRYAFFIAFGTWLCYKFYLIISCINSRRNIRFNNA